MRIRCACFASVRHSRIEEGNLVRFGGGKGTHTSRDRNQQNKIFQKSTQFHIYLNLIQYFCDRHWHDPTVPVKAYQTPTRNTRLSHGTVLSTNQWPQIDQRRGLSYVGDASPHGLELQSYEDKRHLTNRAAFYYRAVVISDLSCSHLHNLIDRKSVV